MFAPDQLVKPEEDKYACTSVAQCVEWDHDLSRPYDQHCHRDGQQVPQRYGWKGPQDGT
jgi:hypothetical protein